MEASAQEAEAAQNFDGWGAESGVSEATNQQAQEWVRESRKRRQSASSCEVAQTEWDSLPPLVQLEFAREVVLPSTQARSVRPRPGRSDLVRLAELAPLHWHALGPNFGKAFLRRFIVTSTRQWGIRSDVNSAAYKAEELTAREGSEMCECGVSLDDCKCK
jgi:hypothetical protein